MASAALILWPFISMYIFSRLGVGRGVIWSMLIGYLFLPEAFGFDLPGIPSLAKPEFIVIGLFAGLAVSSSSRRLLKVPERKVIVTGLTWLLTILTLVSAAMTVSNNGSPIVFIESSLPGLTGADLRSLAFENLTLIAVFFIMKKYLNDTSLHREFLRVLVILGMVYVGLGLIEVRLSPQIHTWTYGYFQHSFFQHIRGGHFRPVVYLSHGLTYGLFLLLALIAALALARSETDSKIRTRYYLFAFCLFFMLTISRNFGAMVIAFMIAPFVLFTSRRIQVFFAATAAVMFLAYPALRQLQLVPLEQIIAFVADIAPDRAGTLAFRIGHEDDFMARALEKPLTGWGNWSRWRIFDEYGRDISIVDGTWIRYLGERGWFGYLAFFGLIASPIFLVATSRRKELLSFETVALAMMLGCTFLYMVPNEALNILTMSIAGAIMGVAQRKGEPSEEVVTAAAEPEQRQGSRYTRFQRSN